MSLSESVSPKLPRYPLCNWKMVSQLSYQGRILDQLYTKEMAVFLKKKKSVNVLVCEFLTLKIFLGLHI